MNKSKTVYEDIISSTPEELAEFLGKVYNMGYSDGSFHRKSNQGHFSLQLMNATIDQLPID